jgi:type II secretory pathway pseudopilin PulG
MDTDKQAWFPVIAVVSVVVLLFGGLMAFLPAQLQQMRHNTYRSQLVTKMMSIAHAMQLYASAHGGNQPDHVGRLVAVGYIGADAFVDPRSATGIAPTYSGEVRPGPVYRFGDMIFFYDPSHSVHSWTSSTAPAAATYQTLLACSTMDYDPTHRVVLTAAGHAMGYESRTFVSQLGVDNANRKAAGLAEVDMKGIEFLDRPATP